MANREPLSYSRQIFWRDVRAELGDDPLDEVLVAQAGGARDTEIVGDVGVDLDDDIAVELQRLQILPLTQVADDESPAARSVRHPGDTCRVQWRLLEDDQRLWIAGFEESEEDVPQDGLIRDALSHDREVTHGQKFCGIPPRRPRTNASERRIGSSSPTGLGGVTRRGDGVSVLVPEDDEEALLLVV